MLSPKKVDRGSAIGHEGHPVFTQIQISKERPRKILAERLDIHYTPKHGSWLNMAEIELSVLKRQCLDRRIPDMTTMQSEGEVADEKKTEITV